MDRRRYHLTVAGETLRLDGPPDIVTMYCALRRAYPAILSVELSTVDDQPRPHGPDAVDGRHKVHSHHGDY
jgi:hypothetical protein